MLRKSANDPTQALATTAAQIAAKVVTSAMDANVSLDPAAAMLGMFEIVGELASVASAEGIYDYGQDELSAAAVRSGEIHARPVSRHRIHFARRSYDGCERAC